MGGWLSGYFGCGACAVRAACDSHCCLSILPAAGATFGGKSAPQAGHINPVNTHTQNTKFNPNPSERRTLACWTLHLRSLIGGARGRRAGATGRRARAVGDAR